MYAEIYTFKPKLETTSKHKGCTTMLHIIGSAYEELLACVYLLLAAFGSMSDPLQLEQGNFEIVANNKKLFERIRSTAGVLVV